MTPSARPGVERTTSVRRGAWSAFAATGDPGAEWPAYDSVQRLTRGWDADPRVLPDPRGGLRRWWAGAR